MVKILEVMVKVQDDKNHIRIYSTDDIEIDSIVIKGQKSFAKPIEVKKSESQKPTKNSKKDSKKR